MRLDRALAQLIRFVNVKREVRYSQLFIASWSTVYLFLLGTYGSRVQCSITTAKSLALPFLYMVLLKSTCLAKHQER